MNKGECSYRKTWPPENMGLETCLPYFKVWQPGACVRCLSSFRHLYLIQFTDYNEQGSGPSHVLKFKRFHNIETKKNSIEYMFQFESLYGHFSKKCK